MNKAKIELWDSVGTGLIIDYPSGVLYSNQTGGTSCLHPDLEGVYVPFGNDYDSESKKYSGPELVLSDYFEGPKHSGAGATNGLDVEDADFIDSVLTKYRLNEWIRVDRSRLTESHEAWVCVTIHSDEEDHDTSIASGFAPYPRAGVLTWANSD